MKRSLYTIFALVMIFVMVAGCATQPAAAPTATQEIVNPPVLKSTNTPSAVEPTATTAAAVEPTATAATVAVSSGPAVVNGVTMPFNRNDVLIMDQGNFAVFDSFNPMIPNGVEFAAGWWQISMEYLFYVNYATGEIIPWLADSYEYSKDYKTMTLHIHKGATWSDGEPFTAKDVEYTMNLCMKDKTLSSCSGDEIYWKSVTATDDYTVVFEMTDPRPRQHLIFYVKICTGQIILPKHIFEKQDIKTFKNNPPVTTGSYTLDKVYPDQKVFVWKKNDNYWNKDKFDPKPKYVIYRSGPSSAEQYLAEAKAGSTDIFGMDYQTYIDKKADMPKIDLVAYVDPCPRGAFFNTAKAPFDKAEFRRAMSMIMNRQKWADNIWVPPSKPAVAPWADYRNLDKYINPDSAKKWGTLEYNVDAAKKLLTDLGYKWENDKLIGLDGKPVAFTVGTPTGVTDREYAIAQDWIEDMKAIGIDATLQHYEQPVWFAKTRSGDFDAGVWWLCGATVDPDELYKNFKGKNATPIGTDVVIGNGDRLNDPELDAVLAKLEVLTPDDPAAMPLYLEAYDLFMRDAAAVPLIQTYYTSNRNNQYWGDTVTNKNMYTVPFNWWGQIVFELFKVTPQ
jgi:peptide/nickel transport system substrate-binding protein